MDRYLLAHNTETLRTESSGWSLQVTLPSPAPEAEVGSQQAQGNLLSSSALPSLGAVEAQQPAQGP